MIPVEEASTATSQVSSIEAVITLESYTSEEFGLSGVLPAGWTEAAPGMYARGADPADQTVLIQKSYPGMTLDQINSALLSQLGIAELPSSLGQYESEDFTWNLYKVEVEAPNVGSFFVDISQVESGGTAFMVLLQTQEEEYETLHQVVFMPAVERVQILE